MAQEKEDKSASNEGAGSADASKRPERFVLDGITYEDFEKLGMLVPDETKDDAPDHSVNDEHRALNQAFSPLMDHNKSGGKTAYERCLRSFLVELKYTGEDRHIAQAMPHFRDVDDLITFRGVLNHLGYNSEVCPVAADTLPSRLPCVLVDDEKHPLVGLRMTDGGNLLVYDGTKGDLVELPLPSGVVTVCAVWPQDKSLYEKNRKISWFFDGLRKFKRKIVLVVALTFVANILALATPIYTMNVYNRVIDSKSLDTLMFFVVAILATIAFEIYIRAVRGRLIAYIGARFNTQLLIRGFERILNFPIAMTESASVSQQIVRLRQFENVQSFFTGPLVSAVLDLPFTIVFVFAISLIHPGLALIPVALAAVFALI
ncbi:MAG: ABC transporter transmembrane domain-containing protein, partial [Pseudomonadota bacterium]